MALEWPAASHGIGYKPTALTIELRRHNPALNAGRSGALQRYTPKNDFYSSESSSTSEDFSLLFFEPGKQIQLPVLACWQHTSPLSPGKQLIRPEAILCGFTSSDGSTVLKTAQLGTARDLPRKGQAQGPIFLKNKDAILVEESVRRPYVETDCLCSRGLSVGRLVVSTYLKTPRTQTTSLPI